MDQRRATIRARVPQPLYSLHSNSNLDRRIDITGEDNKATIHLNDHRQGDGNHGGTVEAFVFDSVRPRYRVAYTSVASFVGWTDTLVSI
jgi:hypothetical protein